MSKKVIGIIIASIFALGSLYLFSIKPGIKKSAINASINSKILNNDKLDVGKKAPEFVVETIEDITLDSKDLKGKVVVMTSSAAWCPTCVMEARNFSPVYHKFKNEDVVFITVDIDPNVSIDEIKAFSESTNTPYNYTNVNGGEELLQKYELNRFEITYVIDKDGIIRHKDSYITTSEELEKVLTPLL